MQSLLMLSLLSITAFVCSYQAFTLRCITGNGTARLASVPLFLCSVFWTRVKVQILLIFQSNGARGMLCQVLPVWRRYMGLRLETFISLSDTDNGKYFHLVQYVVNAQICAAVVRSDMALRRRFGSDASLCAQNHDSG